MIPAGGDARRKYLLKVVLRAGVPSMWAEDAVQDVEIRLWQNGFDHPVVVTNAAIDAARKYGNYSKNGVSRITNELTENSKLADDHADMVAMVVDKVAAFNKIWREATDGQRKWFLRGLQRGRKPALAYRQLAVLRKRMRAAAG